MKNISALIGGLLMGLGLAISGMGDPKNVIGFLDLFGKWNPSLIFVMGGALVVTFIGYKIVMNRPAPLFENGFHLPKLTGIDARLLGGSALFGIGWGLSGYCPGPALISLSQPNVGLIAFLVCFVIGQFIVRKLFSR
jgi:uncharacterized protein